MDSIFPFPSGTDFVEKADRESRLGRLDNPNGGTDCSPCSATRRCRSGLRDEAEGKQRDHENRTESRAEPEVRIQFPPAESRVRTSLASSSQRASPRGSLAGFALRLQRIEFLFEPLLGRLAGVDRTADGSGPPRRGSGFFHRLSLVTRMHGLACRWRRTGAPTNEPRCGEKLIPQGQAGGGGIKNQRINPLH